MSATKISPSPIYIWGRRLAGVDVGGLSRNFAIKKKISPVQESEGVDFSLSKLATFLIQQGFEGVDFSSFSTEGIPDKVWACYQG